jgi:hypothetical protein
MNRNRYLCPIRRLAGLAALLVSMTTGPAAFASSLRPEPPGWLQRPPRAAIRRQRPAPPAPHAAHIPGLTGIPLAGPARHRPGKKERP